ncbi:MAG TPA: hypothetical protein VGX71_05880 [Pseudaminobacter sp.]|nr:hypothetical protein [Pseudaminobacter sp.]
MTKQVENSDHPNKVERPPHQVRLPGFIGNEEIGVGDVMKRTASYFGIQSCGGCERRRGALNRWMVFTKRF